MNVAELQKTWKLRIRKAGFTQNQFAELIDVTPNYLSLLVTGNRAPSVSKLDAIEALLAEHGQKS